MRQLPALELAPIEDALIFISDFDPIDASRLSNSVYRVGLDGKGMRRIAGSIRHPNLGFIRIADIDCHRPSQVMAITGDRDDLDGLYLVNFDGTGLRQVASGGRPLTGIRQIALSPDGKQVILSRAYGGFTETRYGLLRGDLEGGATVTVKLPSEAISYRHPAWSPDGRHIAYIIEEQGSDSSISYKLAIAAPDGTNTRIIQETTWKMGDVAWSPDGAWLSVVINLRIYKVRPDGSDLTPLSDHLGGATSPRWSPDGAQISYVTPSTFAGQNQLYIMNADGRGKRRVVNIRGDVAVGCWLSL